MLKDEQDALGKTIFSRAPGRDEVVVRLAVSKRKARKGEPTGVKMILNELPQAPEHSPNCQWCCYIGKLKSSMCN